MIRENNDRKNNRETGKILLLIEEKVYHLLEIDGF